MQIRLALTLLFLLVACTAASASPAKWLTSWDEAVKTSKAEGNKPILMNFSGSDWCGWCKKLKVEVFDKPEFTDWASENVVLLEIDFPKYKSLSNEQAMANQKLMKKYGISGFPAIFLVDNSEQVLLKTGYKPGGAASYVEHLKQGMR